MKIKDAIYFDAPGGCLSGGHEAKFYPISLMDCSYAEEAFSSYENSSNQPSGEQTVDGVQADKRGNHLAEPDGYIPNFREQSGLQPTVREPVCQNNPFWIDQGYLTPADRRYIEKLCISEQIRLGFKKADRNAKAATDTAVYKKKQEFDLETADIKENMPHYVREGQDGFLYYISPSTNKSTKISEDRFLKAELLTSAHSSGKNIVHIWCENKGLKDFYILEDIFQSDEKLFDKLAQAGIHIKFTRRNKVELLNELKIYISRLYSEHHRTIPHHPYWNNYPDGSVWYAEPDSESEESITNSSNNLLSENDSPWEPVKSDPFEFLKLIILVALNRVAYILTKLLNHPRKWLLLLVDEGQKQYAAALFKGARFITESMGAKEIGDLITSTYSGFAIYLYKPHSKSSTEKLKFISEIVEDGSWDGKSLTTIPLIISEDSIPEELTNYFAIVENHQLMNVKFDDLILDSASMNKLILDFPGICKREKLTSDYGYLFFAGIYAARCLNSDRISQNDIKQLVSDIVDSDENQDGFMSCSADYIDALYKYVTDESVFLYSIKNVPSGYDPEKDILFDGDYLYISKECFSLIVSNYFSNIGINSLKSALRADKILVPHAGSTYTAKASACIDGKVKKITMLRFQRDKLRDSLRRPDIIDFKKLKGDKDE